MKVLQINKFYYPKGGAERYFLDLVEILPAHGHPVVPFSMEHPQNLPTPHARRFVSRVAYEEAGPVRSLLTAKRTLYNPETKRRVKALVAEERPEVAHLHNVHHQLSGSLFDALHEAGIPAVQTLHDFQWVCPVYTFLRHGKVCEACGHGRYAPAIQHRCHGGSLARSAIAALDLRLGYWRGWEKKVSRFLAPSRFLREKVVEHGLPGEKVTELGYCLRLEGYRPTGMPGDHALYAGRLSQEKGVGTLIEALARVPGLELRIAGTGPLEASLQQRAEALAPGRVAFLGHLGPERLREELDAAAFCVVPSEWYENQPYAVLEAFAMETPVVGAAIGGLPELVRPEETGLLFPPGSVEGLSEALARMAARSDRRTMGRNARAWVQERFNPTKHVDALLAVYRGAASKAPA